MMRRPKVKTKAKRRARRRIATPKPGVLQKVNTGPKQGDCPVRRSPGQREVDIEFIWPLYIKGQTFRQIAAALNAERQYSVTHVTVYKDVQHILAEWRKLRLEAIDDLKEAELARINALEREYWEAWERSKAEIEKRLEAVETGAKGTSTREQTTREERLADPRYLQGIQWCIEQRCKILGLNAPERRELTGADGKPLNAIVHHDYDAMATEFRDVLNRQREREAGPVSQIPADSELVHNP